MTAGKKLTDEEKKIFNFVGHARNDLLYSRTSE
jgi:hypothetical protein